MLGAVGDAHLVHHLVDPGAPLARGDVMVEQRKLDILADAQFVDEIEGLEDDADVLAAILNSGERSSVLRGFLESRRILEVEAAALAAARATDDDIA